MKKATYLVAIFFGTGFPILAAPNFLDLSKAANMGLAESLDEAVAISDIKDLEQKNGFKYVPVGLQTFRGVPFQILDPAANNGHSFIVLKGRRKPSFPDAISLKADHLKAAYLYFLHTCRWGGTASNITVAEYDIVYNDGKVEVIPLHVGAEFTNFWGADDTSGSSLAWWYKYKNAEMGLSLFSWKNPRPGEPIQSILFKSLGKMPVPILFAVTASDKEIPISSDSPKPEKTFQTDTSKWIPFVPSQDPSSASAIDLSTFLDAPAGKHGTLKADGNELVFEDGTRTRFWGIRLSGDWWNLPKDQLPKLAEYSAACGCNLISMDIPADAGVTVPLQDWVDALKPRGIYVDFTGPEKAPIPESLTKDPAVIPGNLWTFGKVYRNEISMLKPPLDFLNEPMVMHPETSMPCHLIFGRSLELPYRVEWLNEWPNAYSSETPLLMAAYGSFEDWNACVGMGMAGEDIGFEAKRYMDLSKQPTVTGPLPEVAQWPVIIQWPVAALVYLRDDLKQGKLYVLNAPDQTPGISTSLKALAHRSGFKGAEGELKTDIAGELKAKIQPRLKTFVSDTGQITWQGNVGVIKIDSPRFQALIGFLANRKFNNSYWSVDTPNLFASLSLISLTKTAISASDHLLLTGVTRMENTGMVYNQAKTKVIDPGKGPILVEPLNAKIALYRYQRETGLKVRALDAIGKPLKIKVPVKWVKNTLILSWVPSAFYLEIFK
jgi:hypothetical protein